MPRIAGRRLLLGVLLCGAVALAAWTLVRGPRGTDGLVQVAQKRATAPLAAAAPVESLAVRNKRFVESELVSDLQKIVQRFYSPDNPMRLVEVRAFGAEVEVEFKASRAPGPWMKAARIRGRYCTWRRRLIVYVRPAGSDGWRWMNPSKPASVEIVLPLVGCVDVILGLAEYKETERLFDRLPHDAHAEAEHLRYLFGEPGGEMRMPAGGSGFCADGGRLWFVAGDHELFARDQDGKWHFEGLCPGWWLVAGGGRLVCTAGEDILTRPVDEPSAPWVHWCKIPPMRKGERGGLLAIAGDRLYMAIHPNVFCYRLLADSKAPWTARTGPRPCVA